MRAIFWNSLRERAEVGVAELLEQRLLVLEVEVDGRRRVLDPVGDLAHRDGLVALLGEELAGGVEDPFPEFLSLSLAAFGRSQNVPPKLNYVK